MKLESNFVSIVAIGNFNPAILTPEFLNEVCKFDLGTPTLISPSTFPILREIKFQDLEFFVAFERFQVIERKIEHLKNTKVVSIFKTYYKKLPYTPLRILGVNLNCKLSLTQNEEKELSQKFRQVRIFREILASEFQLTTRVSYNDNLTPLPLGWDIAYAPTAGVKRLINISRVINEIAYNINYNYEVGNVDKDRKRIKLIIDDYESIVTEFDNLINKIMA